MRFSCCSQQISDLFGRHTNKILTLLFLLCILFLQLTELRLLFGLKSLEMIKFVILGIHYTSTSIQTFYFTHRNYDTLLRCFICSINMMRHHIFVHLRSKLVNFVNTLLWIQSGFSAQRHPKPLNFLRIPPPSLLLASVSQLSLAFLNGLI